MDDMVYVGVWSVVPPFVAIALSLITKEVIFSLLIGIMSGALIYSVHTGFGFAGLFTITIDTMISSLAKADNAAMVVFLAFLGGLVALVTRAGGSNAYGVWAARKIKSRQSAGLLTVLLGALIFIDDYFNCLTVGTVMRPVTDRHKISREKLAYLIDATAAPICVIAPISSWAASVISYYPTETGVTGMQAFVGSIPMNLYAVLTIFMALWLGGRKNADYGPMTEAQRRAEESGAVENLKTGRSGEKSEIDGLPISEKGKVRDLIIPVAFLVVFSVLSMLWYGGYWEDGGKSLFDALGDTSAGYALALGGFGALIVAFILFVPRLMRFAEFFKSIGVGIKSMTPAIIILTLAWTISGICRDLLFTGKYVAALVEASSMPVALIPAIMFAIAGALSFSTGTAWGTFGILIPITIAICDIAAPHLSIISLSAVMSGSVFGDHCSPISDTTILSSTGAQCNHIDHVSTQIPYALTVASICVFGYLFAGIAAAWSLSMTAILTLPLCIVLLSAALILLPKIMKEKKEQKV
ncbi:MAG: Na+/H+ antiporter NhaC family protein [Spirochaetaceae bacterium]|jgi:Na+/H+ antiporter NhaC|nr:Na+/H+ antiporter NhaC family protein [Spirochaetaceae bacterium]